MSAEQGALVEGLEKAPAQPPPTTPPVNRKPRLKPVDRQQVCLQVIDPQQLVGEDHPVRAIWDLLGRLDWSPFCEGIKAVEGKPGRDRSDPRVLIALWLYAISRGVREARALDQWAQYEPGCRWLLGLGRINYHTLADFVTQHAAALDELFVQLLHVLMSEGLADLERVAHDGTKIRAAASRGSFKREERLAECRKLAEEHLAALKQQPDAKLSAARRQARQRAARERTERLRRAEEELKRQAAQKAAAENLRASGSDPQARVMRQGDGAFAPSYNAQISTDARQGVILAYEVSQAQEDSQELQPALQRIEENTGRLPKQILVDGGYTTRQNILETAAQPTELVGSLGEDRSQNKLERHGVSPEFMPEHFSFDAAQNCFRCPAGNPLPYKSSKQLVGATEKHYRAKPSDCRACQFASQCCPKMVQQGRGRLLIKTEEDPKVAEFRRKMGQPRYQEIYRRRAAVAEFSNACLKEKKGLRRFLRRGLAKVRAEAAWACLSCNVSIWIRLQWKITLQAAT